MSPAHGRDDRSPAGTPRENDVIRPGTVVSACVSSGTAATGNRRETIVGSRAKCFPRCHFVAIKRDSIPTRIPGSRPTMSAGSNRSKGFQKRAEVDWRSAVHGKDDLDRGWQIHDTRV